MWNASRTWVKRILVFIKKWWKTSNTDKKLAQDRGEWKVFAGGLYPNSDWKPMMMMIMMIQSQPQCSKWKSVNEPKQYFHLDYNISMNLYNTMKETYLKYVYLPLLIQTNLNKHTKLIKKKNLLQIKSCEWQVCTYH